MSWFNKWAKNLEQEIETIYPSKLLEKDTLSLRRNARRNWTTTRFNTNSPIWGNLQLTTAKREA